MSRTARLVALAFCFGVLVFSTTVRADQGGERSMFITFSGPVRIDKTGLPAGSYTFKLADATDRHVVQIYNQRQTHLIAVILSEPGYPSLVLPAEKNQVRFDAISNEGERRSGTVPQAGLALKAWFYPGQDSGHAQQSKTDHALASPAAAMPSENPSPEDRVETPIAPGTETDQTTQQQTATDAVASKAQNPSGPSMSTNASRGNTTANAQSNTNQQGADPFSNPNSQLPQTASNLPLWGMIGALALAAAAFLRIVLKVSA